MLVGFEGSVILQHVSILYEVSPNRNWRLQDVKRESLGDWSSESSHYSWLVACEDVFIAMIMIVRCVPCVMCVTLDSTPYLLYERSPDWPREMFPRYTEMSSHAYTGPHNLYASTLEQNASSNIQVS